MNPRVVIGPRISIEAELEVEVIHTLYPQRVPDIGWGYTDPAGHLHGFTPDGDVPTLEWVVTLVYYCEDCRDDHSEGEYRCKICGAVVEPQFKTSYEPYVATGPMKYTLCVEDVRIPLEPEEWEAGTAVASDREKLVAWALAIAAARGIHWTGGTI